MSRIRALRKQMNVSQARFADMLGVHQTAVSQWETGRTAPDIDTLMTIAKLTGKSIDYIMDFDISSPARASDGERFWLTMDDEGMIGARVKKGDEVLFERCQDAPDGIICAIETDCGVMIRYICHLPDALMLVSASSEYAPRALSDNFRVIGRAVGFYSKLNIKSWVLPCPNR